VCSSGVTVCDRAKVEGPASALTGGSGIGVGTGASIGVATGTSTGCTGELGSRALAATFGLVLGDNPGGGPDFVVNTLAGPIGNVTTFFRGDVCVEPAFVLCAELPLLSRAMTVAEMVEGFFFSFSTLTGKTGTGDGVGRGKAALFLLALRGMRAVLIGRATGAVAAVREGTRAGAGLIPQLEVRGRAEARISIVREKHSLSMTSSATGFGQADFCVNGGGCNWACFCRAS
jgi:hypothetical protein